MPCTLVCFCSDAGLGDAQLTIRRGRLEPPTNQIAAAVTEKSTAAQVSPLYKIKGQCAGNTPSSLILA